MFQLPHFPNYLQFLGSMLLLIAIFIAAFLWTMRKAIGDLQKSSDYTDLEVGTVRRQMLALLVGTPIVVLFLTLSPMIWERPSPYMVYIGLVLGFAPLAYIAVSSIRNRVSILRGRERLPLKGAKAVRSGVINLVLVILMVTGSAIFFASQFASLK